MFDFSVLHVYLKILGKMDVLQRLSETAPEPQVLQRRRPLEIGDGVVESVAKLEKLETLRPRHPLSDVLVEVAVEGQTPQPFRPNHPIQGLVEASSEVDFPETGAVPRHVVERLVEASAELHGPQARREHHPGQGLVEGIPEPDVSQRRREADVGDALVELPPEGDGLDSRRQNHLCQRAVELVAERQTVGANGWHSPDDPRRRSAVVASFVAGVGPETPGGLVRHLDVETDCRAAILAGRQRGELQLLGRRAGDPARNQDGSQGRGEQVLPPGCCCCFRACRAVRYRQLGSFGQHTWTTFNAWEHSAYYDWECRKLVEKGVWAKGRSKR